MASGSNGDQRGKDMTTLIKNGTVVSATGRHAAEVLVDGTSIAAVMAPGSAPAQAAESAADRPVP